MSGLRRAISAICMSLAVLMGGILGAVVLSFVAMDVGFRLTFPANYDPEFPGPGDGFALAPFFGVGAIFGFSVGVCLVLYGRRKFVEYRRRSLPMTGHQAT